MGEGNLDQFTKTMEQVKLYVGWAYGDRFCHSGWWTAPWGTITPHATQKHTGYYQLEDWLMHEYANFKTGVYTMVLGQCKGASRDKLKLHPDLTMELLCLKWWSWSYIHLKKPATRKMSGWWWKWPSSHSLHGTNDLQQYRKLFHGQAAGLNELGVTIDNMAVAIKINSKKGHNFVEVHE